MDIFRLYLDFMIKNPKYLLMTLVLMSVIPVNDIYLSKKYGELFESINKNTVNLHNFATILGILIFLQIAYGIEDIHLSKQSPDLQHHCRKAILRGFFDNNDNSTGDIKTGDVVSKIIRCENILNNWYNKIFSYLVPYLIEFICTIYFVYIIDKRLCMYMFMITLLFIFVLIYSPKSCNDTTNADGLMTKVYDEIEDILINCTLVMKENTLNDELIRLDKFNRIYKKIYLQTVKCSLKYRLILSAILILFLVLFVLRSYHLLKNNMVSNAMFYPPAPAVAVFACASCPPPAVNPFATATPQTSTPHPHNTLHHKRAHQRSRGVALQPPSACVLAGCRSLLLLAPFLPASAAGGPRPSRTHSRRLRVLAPPPPLSTRSPPPHCIPAHTQPHPH